MDFSKLKELKNHNPGRKKAVGSILKVPELWTISKDWAEETGVNMETKEVYRSLSFLDWSRRNAKKLTMKWVA